MSVESNRRRLLYGTALIILGVAFATDPLTHTLSRFHSPTHLRIALEGFATLILMPALVGSVAGISGMLRGRTDRVGLFGATLAIMGFTAGMRIGAAGQLDSLAHLGIAGVPADVIGKMFRAAPIVWTSIVGVGLLFPIGLITLGAAIAATAAIPRWIGAMMIVGGVLFPIGRILLLPWAIVASDIVLGATFLLVAWQEHGHAEPRRDNATAGGVS